jgi:MFS family permease
VYAVGARLNTYLISLLATGIALMAAPSGFAGVLLPGKIYGFFPEDAAARDATLAQVLAVSAVFTLITQPLIGMLSDNTRSRFGQRTPYMLIGAIGGLIFTFGLQVSSTVVTVTVFWVLVQICLNIIQGPLQTTVADRVPVERRGIASSLIGVTAIVGGTLGSIVAGRLSNAIGDVSFTVIGIAVLVVILAFVLINPDRPSRDLPRNRFSFREFVSTFWVNPRTAPDFAWAFAARFLMMIGYWAVQVFQFNLLLAYVQPSLAFEQVNIEMGTLGLITMVGALIASFVFGRLSDRIGRRKPFVIGASIAMAVALTIPMLSPTLPAFYAWAAINGLAFGAYMSIDMALIIDVLPDPARFGKDLGVMNIATVLPQAIGPVLAAWISAAWGYPALFAWAIFWVLLAIVFILPIKKTR